MTTPQRVVAGVSVISAVVAGLISRRLFPLLSSDNDEAIYRLQAQTLARGHLFPPAPAPAASFTPWLAAVVGHHYVLKYTPFVSGVYAASLWLTGSFVPALALVAAAAVWVTFALARELLGDDGAAALAAVLVGASPLATKAQRARPEPARSELGGGRTPRRSSQANASRSTTVGR